MENIGIYATKDVNINDIIKDTIKEVNEGMSLMCDNLVAEAERTTNTLEEYKAYMKGAAFATMRVFSNHTCFLKVIGNKFDRNEKEV